MKDIPTLIALMRVATDKNLPLVVAVVPAFNRCDKTLNFVRQFAAVNYPNKRVVICDDGSTDNTHANISLNFPGISVLRGNGDLWWSGGTNLAIHHALSIGADYILTINDDAHMEPDFLTEMVRTAQQNLKYIVGCRIHRQDETDRIWSIGATPVFKRYEIYSLNFWGKPWNGIRGKISDPHPVITMPGNGVLIPRSVFEEVGYYDEIEMPQYHADTDLVLRARKRGYIPVISLNSVIYNHIPTKPLVNDRYNLIFNKKSDRYWRALWATLRRHGPFGKRAWLLMMQYAPFFTPGWTIRIYQQFHRRYATQPTLSQGSS